MKVVFYGINGQGLGHIARLLNIAGVLKELVNALDMKAEFSFLTTSEASHIITDFPVYKIPSLKVFDNPNYRIRDQITHGRFFVSNLFASLRPDVVIMDTTPVGAFGEFMLIRDFCTTKVFINRHSAMSGEPENPKNNALNMYDLILTPDHPDHHLKYYFPSTINANVFTDVIHGFRRDLALERDAVRSYFGVEEDQKLVYISAGGGGDIGAEEQLDILYNALKHRRDIKFLFGYGPLYRGRIIYNDHIIPYTGDNIRQFFLGIDASICAAGYNTYEELLAAGIPTLFYSQVKQMDRQDIRIKEGQQHGWNDYFDTFPNCDNLDSRLTALLSPNNSVFENLLKKEPSYGSLNTALEIIKESVQANNSPLSEASIYLAARLFKVWLSLPAGRKRYRFSDIARWTFFLQPLAAGIDQWNSFAQNCQRLYDRSNAELEQSILSLFNQTSRFLQIKMKKSHLSDSEVKSAMEKYLRNYKLENFSENDLP